MKKFKKIISFCIVLFTSFSLLNSLSVNASSIKRLAGLNRYETSAKISSNFSTSDFAVIATGKDYPDALSATPLAKKYNAPIILTEGKTLNTEALNELKRLKVKKVFIVGGTGVVSNDISKSIQKLGIEVKRIAGANRYETSYEVAKIVGTSNGAFVTTGLNFADALSVGPIAATLGMPIILVSKTDSGVNLNVNKTYVIGGEAIVPNKALSKFKNITRIYGSNRYETNKKLVNTFSNVLNFSNAYVATGIDFPDALAGGALAAVNNNPIILTGKTPDISSKNIITENNITNLTVLGGEGVVPTSTVNSLLGYVATTGDIRITSLGLEKEIVVLKNYSNMDINMTGWRLVSVVGNQTFEFPDGYIMKANSQITIASGKSTGTLKWTTSNIWNNDGDKAELYDGSNKLISYK